MIYCILCGRKDKSVSYIRFPSNKHIRKQWLKFCNKTEKNLYDSHRLCTDHFKPEDLRKRSRCIVVQPEAVPCIYIFGGGTPPSTFVGNASKTDDGNICSTGITNSDSSNDNINVVNYSQSTTAVTENITHTSPNRITSSCGTRKKSQDFAKEDMSSMDVNVDVDPVHCTEIGNCEILPNNCLTPLKRRKDAHCSSKRKRLDFNDSIDSTIPIHELPVPAITSAICDSAPPMIPDPRYVGDIRSPHLATPRRATRAMNLARRTIMQQRKKIETLQKKFGRCKQRISSLKDLVSDLKKRNYISEIAADNLMVCLNNIYRSMKAPNKANAFIEGFE
ncbi:uncharacterized protein [Temnothorax nylanderi]|uniref:uncharacterized protein n=1 Tax=Temnothorax nylanderi TaxID=102681 RepID=UPI003A8AB3DB